jgi:vitamin B12 transporter
LQTLVLIDGVPLTKQDASGAISLEHLMLDNIERVEIVRGNVSAIYGSGAIGGVIQIFTRSGGRGPGADLSVEIGPRASTKVSASVHTQAGNTAVSAGASRLSTEGFSALNPDQFAGSNPDTDGYHNTSSHVALVHKISGAHSFGVRAAQSDADTQYDNAYGAPADIQTSTTRLNQASLFSDNTWGQWRSRLVLSQQRDRSRIHDNGAYGSNDGFTTQTTVLSWVNSVKFGNDWLGTAGLDHQRQHVDTNSDSPWVTPYDRNRDASALFAGMQGDFGRNSVQLNVRRDRVADLGQTTGYVGYGYALTDFVKLTASTSSAFNAPPLGYLYAPSYGNPSLKPERARSREVGVQYEQGQHRARATYFDTRIEDQLDYDFVTSAFANLGRTRNSGIELSYRGKWGECDLRASLTLQDPVDAITQQRLLRRAEHLLTFGVSQPFGAWLAGGDVQYSSARPDAYSDPATFNKVYTNLAASTVLDLTLSYKVTPSVMIKARLDNATDARYQTVYGYNQQARSIYLGATWSPKL